MDDKWGQVKMMLSNKIIALNDDIREKKQNVVVAYKLGFTLSGESIEKELSLLIDFRNWLLDLEQVYNG